MPSSPYTENMKFTELPYKRPDIKELKTQFESSLDEMKQQKDAGGQLNVMQQINRLRSDFESQCSLAAIRHTQNTADPFYEEENNFSDENHPIYDEMVTRYSRTLLDSPYKAELEQRLGKQFFRLAEMNLRSFSEEIVEDSQIENKLGTEYIKLLSSAQIPFQGELRNLSQLTPFEESPDRNIRQEALTARFSFFQDKGEELDRIFHDMVEVRTRIARKLGYENFIPLAYMRMSRSDYGAKETAAFRKSVHKHLVPLAEELYQRQWKRIGVEQGKIWDEKYRFPSGNPTPKGDRSWMVEQAKKLYRELSPETDRFFSFMCDSELMDLDARKNKAGGGYCELLPQFGTPFIFANFNGTSGDVDVLTHEAGHAFQVFSCLKDWQDRGYQNPLLEYLWPTYEACEIHSMSMEYLAWPWMEDFFKQDTDKYRYAHLSDYLQFIPYGVTVDEFQHLVYQNPEAMPEDRHRMWKETAAKYHPSVDYGGIPYLEKGGFWQRQNHIYKSPFYYIDYTLAETCALQYWSWTQKAPEKAWESYLKLCKAGGKDSFLNLIQEAGLKSPFEESTLKEVIQKAGQWLSDIDDSRF